MLDKYTLEEMEKYIDNRIAKLKESMVLYTKQEFQYVVYKNLIMELQNVKAYINRKMGKIKK